jgi:hypothetical protein
LGAPAAPITYGLVHTDAEGGIPGGVYAPGEPVGSYVSFYVAVDDLERSLQQAETLGAKVAQPPTPLATAAAWPWSTTPRATALASSSHTAGLTARRSGDRLARPAGAVAGEWDAQRS